MNRFALLAVAIVAVVIAWFVFFAGPTVEAPPPVEAPTVEAPPPSAPVPAATPPTPVAPPPVEEAAPDAAVDAETPSGPVTVDLGQHDILLAERDGRFLQLQIGIVAADPAAATAVRLKRRAMVRMLYFLVTKRSAEGVEAAGGQQRLVDDLLPRFRNLARTAKIDGLEVKRFRVITKELKQPDAGP